MSEKKNRRAVNITERLALQLNWFFRPQDISDFGVDALVEKFSTTQGRGGNETEHASGRLLALQIKGGSSYFKKQTPTGWWFRFGSKKHRYWLNHALPVIVVLVDLDTETAYWQEVSPRTVKAAGKGFKVEVPRTQQVSDADPVWSELASGLERAAENRFDYSLSVLPPGAKSLLEARRAEEHADAALLAMHLAQGRLNAHGTVASLRAANPAWLKRAGEWGWSAIGNFASAHELEHEAGLAFVNSAELSEPGRRGAKLAAAATHLCRFDPDRARELMMQADEEAELGLSAANLTLTSDAMIRAAARTILAEPSRRKAPTRSLDPLAVRPSDVPWSSGDEQWRLDPLLVSGGPDVDASAAAQRVLALHAEARSDYDLAIRHAQAAVRLDPQSSSAKLLAARMYLYRSTEPTGLTSDIRNAVELYESAISDRLRWSGPTRGARSDLAQALMGAGRLEEVIKLTLPVPFGTADEAELDPVCVRMGVRAASVRGRRDIVDEASRFLGTTPADQLLKAALGEVELPQADVNALRVRVLDDAMAVKQWEEALSSALTLLRDGVDVQDRLDQLTSHGIVDEVVADLGKALWIAHSDLDEAIPRLRELAKIWNPAGSNFLLVLKAAGRFREAASAAQQLHQLTGSDQYLLEQADALVDLCLSLERAKKNDEQAADDVEDREDEPDLGDEHDATVLEEESNEALEAAVSDAIEACRDALAVTWLHPHDRGRLLTFLGSRAASEGDWVSAERHTAAVLDLFEVPGDGNVWRNVSCLINVGRLRDAVRVIADYRPKVRSLEDAGLWLQAHSTSPWSHAVAVEAWAHAEELDDPKFWAAVCAHIVTNTRGAEIDPTPEVEHQEGPEPGQDTASDAVDGDEAAADGARSPENATGFEDLAEDLEEDLEEDAQLERRRELAQELVPGELHRRAFQMLARVADEHPDATGIQVIRGDSPEDAVQVLVEQLQRHSEFDAAVQDLARRALVGQMPIGMLAGVLGRSYATLVIQRGLGVLPAASPDDNEHYSEVETAAASFDRTVVVDSATVVTLAGLADRTTLTGRFASLAATPATMHDLNGSYFDIRGLAGSPGSIRWDSVRRTVATTDLGETEYVRIFQRAEQVQVLADRLNVISVPQPRLLLSKLAGDERASVWVDAIEAAHHHDVALYSDDLSLRRLARSLGVPAFGTPALIDAIRDTALASVPAGDDDRFGAVLDQHAQGNLALVRDHLVDVVVTEEELVDLAEQESWRAGAASSVISRPKWWFENPQGIGTVFQILNQAATTEPENAAAWQWAAMHGVASATEPHTASRLLALLAFRGFSEEPTEEERALGLLRGRDVASIVGVPDPTSVIGEVVSEELEGLQLAAPVTALVDRVIALADSISATSREPSDVDGASEPDGDAGSSPSSEGASPHVEHDQARASDTADPDPDSDPDLDPEPGDRT